MDGSSYLYRAFHALPDLRTSRGEPTGALRGVVSMLRRIAEDGKPDYFAVVFDAPGKTFRDEWYPEYKANRPPMPDDLVRQIEPLHELVRANGWPLLMIEGVEADDVIGTLAAQATASGIATMISTGDKDLAQLVRPGVTLVNTMSNETLDEEGVVAKFGVRADQVLDFLTLTGDAVDNVPGVPKVGPKTAAKWLAQYGTLDTIVAHADEIAGVVGENLRATRDWLPTGQEAPHRQDGLRPAAGASGPRAARAGQGQAPCALRALRFQELAARRRRRQRARPERRDRRSRVAPGDAARSRRRTRTIRRRTRGRRCRGITKPCTTKRRSRAGST